ncbi:hypothetical protein [Luedemannella helvata]|uniref:Ankyrin repeat domain-containing protein n=1 Tax=Luedemannella helvata TaxID=349315 RepID=A0ABP4VYP8_9ACTN
MSDARRVFVDLNVAGWLAARRNAVPARMVTEAAARRAVGDWRGALAAARFTTRVDLAEVRDRYGAEMAAQVEDDLCHLAPDLVRWHLSRADRDGLGLLTPAQRVPLAFYADGVALHVVTPPHAERPQRLELHVGPLHAGPLPPMVGHRDDWSRARYLWDARVTAELLRRVGGDRAAFFHRDGRARTAAELAAPAAADDLAALIERVTTLQDSGEVEKAWTAAGVRADFPPATARWGRPRMDHAFPEPFGAMVPILVPAARHMLARTGAPAIALRPSFGWASRVVLRDQDGQLTAERASTYTDGLPNLPYAHWRRLPDLELLRTGHIGTHEVHPLVRAALFPEESDPDYRPRTPDVPASVPVRCRGQWHRVGWRDGRVHAHDHTDDEAQRERVMRALGGEVPGCFTVAETWQGSATGRLPRQLRDLRAHALAALAHGDVDEFARLLDLGVDPAGVRDRWQRGPLHHLGRIDDESLLVRLLAAGMDINVRDNKGRTPLLAALFDGAPATLVRAMLDAGADPTVTDDMGDSTLHLLRSPDAAVIVPWLVAAGVALDAIDEYGRPPLLAQVLTMAPLAVIRATLDAGADPAQPDEYTEMSVLDVIVQARRDDLAFLVAAAKAAGVEEE